MMPRFSEELSDSKDICHIEAFEDNNLRCWELAMQNPECSMQA
jgi:hypothetical protein